MLTFVLLMAVLSPVSAQIVKSQSERIIVTKEPKVKKEKKPRTVKFLIKGGIGGDFEEDNRFGYEASLGIAMPAGKKGLLWMPEIGFMSGGHNTFINLSGAKVTEFYGLSGSIYTLQASPINFGWKFRMSNIISLLPVVGLYGGYFWGRTNYYGDEKRGYYNNYFYPDYYSKYETTSDNRFDLGANIGLNLLIKERFLLGIQTRFGFLGRREEVFYRTNGSWSDIHNERHRLKKLMFTFGIMF